MTTTKKISIFAIIIIAIATLITTIVVVNRNSYNTATAQAEARVEALVSEYSKLSVSDEVIIDPIVYRYNEEFGAEERLIETTRCGDKIILSVITVNLHYETLEEIGKDTFVSYCHSLSGAEDTVVLLVSCEPQTREYCYYEENGLTIISLYSNTEYEGTLLVDNYSHPGYITFSTKE